ncbi:predicted protein [Naegleria gruberi]|uniref:Predicted protein n=1 Tax=Naegleria gruberi TaxID=5762 RepID=D2V057_NAEGR|nr:uncharacterized protein NAEGRDRAFT_45626 [Naegleria gruberi]EFC49470.1 predicted protein [Naegleria gruberi]|eukprot:XP_002682214.1 predicted protein [Naegleria gruberi strain NEG-M]
MPCGRYGHSACIHNDYLMYIYGGYYRNKTNELSCLNLETGEWKVVECRGNQIPPGTDGQSMIIYNNQLIIFGGRKKSWISINLVHVLDLETLEWRRVEITDLSNVPCPRTDHCDVFHDGKLYIQGGYDDGGQFLGRRNDLYVFDVKTETWTQLTGQCNGLPPPEMSTHRAECLELNGKHYMIMVAGWDNYKRHRNEIYGLELETLTWIHFPSINPNIFHERRHFGMVKLSSSIQSEYFRGNDLIVYGGCTDTCMLNDVCVLRLSDSSVNEDELVEVSSISEFDNGKTEELWKLLMNEHSNCFERILEFGNCYDLLDWSLVNKKQWNSSISNNNLLKKAVIQYWNYRNRHLIDGNAKILKLLPKEATLKILQEDDDNISITTVKNLIHQLTDTFFFADPYENIAWTSFPKINSLLGIAKLNFSKIESQLDNNFSFYMALHSTCFDEYPIITSIISTSRKTIKSPRETFILFDPYIGSLIFTEKVQTKMLNDFKRLLTTTISPSITIPLIDSQLSDTPLSNSQNGSILEDILSVLLRNASIQKDKR